MKTDELSNLDVNEFRKRISSYVRNPIEVVNKDYFYILDPGSRPIRKANGFSRGLHSAFGWVPANPNSSEASDATTLLYEERTSSVEPSLIPTAVGFKVFLDQLTSDSRIPDLYLVGNRGCGKTFVQNKLINHNLKDLNSKGFTYFRADVAKLHEFNTRLLGNTTSTDSRMTIQEYMALHAFFVVLSHGKSTSLDPGLAKFHLDHDAVRVRKRDQIRGSIEVSTFFNFLEKESGSKELGASWVHIAKSFALKKPDPDKEDEDLFSFLENCRSNAELSKYLVLQIFDIFMQFVTAVTSDSKGEFPEAKVLLIVDGADNLRTDDYLSNDAWIGGKSSGNWYKLYLNDMKLMSCRRGISSLAHRTVFAVRPDTYKDLIDIDKAERHQEDLRLKSTTHYVAAPCATSMFERKRKAAKENPGPALFNRGLENTDLPTSPEYQREVPELHQCFEYFIARFFAIHISELKSCGFAKANENDVLSIVFNSNVRSLSRNAIRTFDAAYEYHAKSIKLLQLTAEQRIENFKEIPDNHLFELSVTGGNSYFIENSNEHAKGRWCPNLFEFQSTGDQRRWDGLVLLRILQLLPSKDEEIAAPTADTIQIELSAMGYVMLQVQSALWCAGDFGLIEKRGSHFTSKGKSEPTFQKTEKGSYIQHLVFQNSTVLYLMGTGISASGVGTKDNDKRDKRIEERWLHSPDVKDRHFWSAALKTTSHLLRHIESSDQRDKNFAGSKFNQRFVLPSLVPIERNLALAVYGLREIEPESKSIAAIFTYFEQSLALKI